MEVATTQEGVLYPPARCLPHLLPCSLISPPNLAFAYLPHPLQAGVLQGFLSVELLRVYSTALLCREVAWN